MLNKLLDDTVAIDVQNPIQVNERTQVYPDLMLIPSARSSRMVPVPTDVLLVVEVSDSTIGLDRRIKVPVYAEAGIPELWLVDVGRERVIQHREPAEGKYAVITEVNRGDHVHATVSPTLTITVAIDDLFD